MDLFPIFSPHNKTVKKYQKYRKAGRKFVNDIMHSSLQGDAVLESARLLGMVPEGRTIVFDSEDETSVLMDFALHEYRIAGKNAIETYQTETGGKNEVEKELLAGWIASSTSLFKVQAVSAIESNLTLSDVLNQRDDIKLMDVSFSQTASPGMLLFFRLVPMPQFFMTSGVSFVFSGKSENQIVKKYQKLMDKLSGHTDSMKRFIAFFQLYKKHGLPVNYV